MTFPEFDPEDCGVGSVSNATVLCRDLSRWTGQARSIVASYDATVLIRRTRSAGYEKTIGRKDLPGLKGSVGVSPKELRRGGVYVWQVFWYARQDTIEGS